MVPTSARLVITGPGLSEPITEGWQGSCFALQRFACSNQPGFHPEMRGFPSDLGRVHGALWTLALDSNFLSLTGGVSGTPHAPAPLASLGPKYHVTWVVTKGGATETIEQDLYPYGPPLAAGLPGVPWIHTGAGQTAFGEPLGPGWMPTPPYFLDDLAAYGMPTTPPGVQHASSPVQAPPAHPQPVDGRSLPGWAIALGAGLLLALVVAGAAAGRPRRGLRTA